MLITDFRRLKTPLSVSVTKVRFLKFDTAPPIPQAQFLNTDFSRISTQTDWYRMCEIEDKELETRNRKGEIAVKVSNLNAPPNF
ncbi:hypothetical protein N24_0272 [Corynebacterium suranareeae]|uniref:Uncharacterized protein n=1 Tax=Corynebacterium suranareeae TaxID=2506452 RepID=A0A160PML8_9CORY|nr:hypothetical protein N24_0272 [Corynebacterium suranareeae]